MDAKPMDKAAEDQLLGAVKEAVAWVEDGIDPTDAIVKVASQSNLNPPMTALLVQAYNTGRTAFQREKCSGDVLCKVADFPIARVENVLGRLWPSEPKTAAAYPADHVPDCFNRPPGDTPRDIVMLREKVAHVALPKAASVEEDEYAIPDMIGAFNQLEKVGKQVEEARHQAKVARDRYLSAMGKLADYFLESEMFREKFAEVEHNAAVMFGPPATYAMDYVYSRNKMREKRAGADPTYWVPARPVNPNAAPYSLIKSAIDLGAAVLQAQREHRDLQKEASQAKEATEVPFSELPNANPTQFSVLGSEYPPSSQNDQPSFNKEGGLFGNIMTGATVAGMSNMAKVQPKSTDDLISANQAELADPQHQNALREIEAQTMLSDFLNNDEVLSGHDPDEVLQAYNEVVSLSPHAATQPAVMRPLLRKRLAQGSYEPFEAQQIADIEKSVAQTQQGLGGLKLSEVIDGSPILS